MTVTSLLHEPSESVSFNIFDMSLRQVAILADKSRGVSPVILAFSLGRLLQSLGDIFRFTNRDDRLIIIGINSGQQVNSGTVQLMTFKVVSEIIPWSGNRFTDPVRNFSCPKPGRAAFHEK